MGDELIDLCDEHNHLTGEQKMKSEAHAKGLWHRATHVWIYTSQGEVLLQFRNKNKLLFPAVWDVSVGGHVSAGEEVIVSTMRETEEEVGIKASAQDFEFVKVMQSEMQYKDIDNKEFIYVFLLKFDGKAGDLAIQEEEVERVAFFTLPEVDALVRQGRKVIITHDEYWQEIKKSIQERTQ